MKMIGHETKSVDLPAGLVTSLAKSEQKTLAVAVVLEDGFAAVAAIHQVIEATGYSIRNWRGIGAIYPRPPPPSTANSEDRPLHEKLAQRSKFIGNTGA